MWCFNIGESIYTTTIHDPLLYHPPHTTETVQWSHLEMQGDLPPSMSRALSDAHRGQDRDNRRRRGRLVLQQRVTMHLRLPDMAMVAADLHDEGGSSSTTCAHSGAVPERDLGIGGRNSLQAFNDVWTRSTSVARRSTGCARNRSPLRAVRGPPHAVITPPMWCITS
jgi:hypothetical protein